MAKGPLQAVIRCLRRTASHGIGALTDGQLLQRFVADRDEGAFELLVWRHGPMVLATCRRVLRHAQDAEDAFQATFLALARQARSISDGEAVAGWLYRVAFRTALRARSDALHRARREKASPLPSAADPFDGVAAGELREVFDEEVDRLPERYRVAVVLCYLEGKTVEEAARQMGRPRGTVLSWLARARALLRARLTRRGWTLSAAALAGMLSRQTASATVPVALADAAVRAALARSAVLGDTDRIRRLIADLESKQFAVREKARTELEEMGEAAESELRDTLNGQRTLELRRRVEQLLEKLDPQHSPTWLRTVRALEVLERLGTAEARKLLEELAAGAPEMRLTREARAALRRLAA